ncbi:hypothetical protein GQ600_4626 [Phytophthora cactorum]|nr:hypothetical protein GQ600_4626 [Phytophthora cactorum]
MEATSPARMASAELRATVSTLPVLDEQSSSERRDSDVLAATTLFQPRVRARRPLAETGDPCMLAASESDEVTSLDALESEKSEQIRHGRVDIVVDQEDAPRSQTSLSIGSQPSYESSSFAWAELFYGREGVHSAGQKGDSKTPTEIWITRSDEQRGEEGNRGGPKKETSALCLDAGQSGAEDEEEDRRYPEFLLRGWLVACSLFVVLLNTFAIAIVQLTTIQREMLEKMQIHDDSADIGSSY